VRDVAQAVLDVLASGRPAALATVVRVSGSTPQNPGARLLLRWDGSIVGTVGGGAIELDVLAALREAMESGKSRMLARELGYDLGMCCGGRMEVFIEPIAITPRLILLGAGHVAKPTAALARNVGFDVLVVDEREELATAERFPGCEIERRDPTSMLRRVRLGERDWLLIITHDHQVDQAALALALQQTPRYIGLIGSKRKVFRLLQRIAASGDKLALERVYAPVGLDIGAAGPDEIAVSIVAELIALRHGRTVTHLRAVHDERLLRSLSVDGDELDNEAADTPHVDAISQLPPMAAAAIGLSALEKQVHADLELLNYPQREWLQPRRRSGDGGAAIYDVIIVGAGQGGLAAAFGLMRERVKNLLVIDQNPLDRAGPWLNFARMRTLRTPKYLTGPDLGIPSLTPRNWYEAQHGPGSWAALGLIPKETWAAYLAWYRSTLGIPVRPDTQVGALRWDETERVFVVPCTRAGVQDELYARRVVLATGIDGSGRWEIPRMISDALPERSYSHTRYDIDFAALRGKRIAVLGAGASAFDNASTALDHGAAEVKLFFVGFLRHLGDLPDADKWRFIAQIQRMGQLPPTDTMRRASEHPGFHLQPGSAWRRVETRGETILIHTDLGVYECDYVIIGTGFVTDLSVRPELTQIERHIARWSDRFTPPPEERNEDLLRHPYLGAHFEFTERTPGEAPWLKYLYNYTFGCLLSLGFGGASISGMKYSIPRLVSGITGSFFSEDSARYYESLCQFEEREF
jgi:xanthine/CO dehydrogenase XdhC/CoxF family maturation factor/thioredoxin reductase